MAGWAVENTNQAAQNRVPLTILVFVEGKNAFQTETKGNQPDIAKAFNYSEASSKNMAFTGTFSCSSGANVTVVAVTVGNLYGVLKPTVCPQ
jgi:hypothetical protein